MSVFHRQIDASTRFGSRWLCWGAMLCLLILFAMLSSPVAAQTTGTAVATISISPSTPFSVGETVKLAATLRDASGRPLLGELIEININGKKVRQDLTDANGVVRFEIGDTWPIGAYTVQFIYVGSPFYAPVRAVGSFSVRPLFFTVNTVPAIPNIQIKIAGNTYLTDGSGRARIELPLPDIYSLEVILPTDLTDGVGKQLTFDGWGDAVASRQRAITISADETLEAGFVFRYPVTVQVRSGENRPIPTDQLLFLNSNGEQLTLSQDTPQFLPANHIVRTNVALSSQPVTYQLIRAAAGDRPLVQPNGRQFSPDIESVWSFEATMYSLRLRAKERLGRPLINAAFQLQYPDGHIETLPLGTDNVVQVDHLLPGQYQAQLIGSLRNQQPIVIDLNRHQNVLVTGLSVASVTAIMLTLFALCVIGWAIVWFFKMLEQQIKRRPVRVQQVASNAAPPVLQEARPITRTMFYLPPAQRRVFNSLAPLRPMAAILGLFALIFALVGVYFLGQSQRNKEAVVEVNPPVIELTVVQSQAVVPIAPTQTSLPTAEPLFAPTLAPIINSATPVASDGTAPQPLPQPANSQGVTYIVQRGDTLTKISKQFLGSAGQWRRIYDANRSQLPSPNSLKPGTPLVIPIITQP